MNAQRTIRHLLFLPLFLVHPLILWAGSTQAQGNPFPPGVPGEPGNVGPGSHRGPSSSNPGMGRGGPDGWGGAPGHQESEGRLAPDARVAEFLPAFDTEATGEISVEQLLTHRSGLPVSVAWDPENPPSSLQAHARAIAEAGPQVQPG